MHIHNSEKPLEKSTWFESTNATVKKDTGLILLPSRRRIFKNYNITEGRWYFMILTESIVVSKVEYAVKKHCLAKANERTYLPTIFLWTHE